MSIVSLNSVFTRSKATQTDFYLGSIIDSKSGFLIPKLISTTEDLDAFYGDFDYKDMFKSFIGNDIPVVLLPIITPLSKYNVCSLRLSNGPIPVCYPKYGKDYEYVSLGSLHVYDFTADDLDDENSITVDNPLNFNPQIVVESASVEVECNIRYHDNKITVYFSEKVSGSITIESLPQIEGNPDYLKVDKVTNGEYKLFLEQGIIPEVVVTDSEGYSIMVTPYLTEVDNGYEVTVPLPNYDPDESYDISVRIIPEYLLVSKSLVSDSTIVNHNLNHYPNFKLTKDMLLSMGQVEFRTQNSAIVTVTNSNGVILRYNIVTDQVTFNWKELYAQETTFNSIIDFTDVTEETLNTPGKFFILELNSGNHLISTEGTLPPWLYTTYYNFRKILSGVTKREKIADLKSYIQVVLGTQKCTDLTDRIWLFLESEIKRLKVPEQDMYEEWQSQVIQDSYANDFWICTNSEAISILKQIFEGLPEVSDIFEIELKSVLTNLNLSNDKLLLEYSVPCQNLNFYNMDNLLITQDFNLSQDKLCELTERDKICEFYSKSKGESGKNIIITIERAALYDYVYDITIKSGSKIEMYTVFTYKNGTDELPDDCIPFHQISNKSELVNARLFDYKLQSGKLIDQLEFEVYKSANELYDPERLRDPSELRLLEGTWTLDRTLIEDYTYEDMKSSIEIYEESDWYPDLFLVNKVDYGEDNEDYMKQVLQLANNIFTQALVKLSYQHLTYNFDRVDSNNRMLYFYDDIYVDKEQYCVFHPYTINIINSDYLKIIDFDLIADSTELKVGNGIIVDALPALITYLSGTNIEVMTVTGTKIEGTLEDNKITSGNTVYTITPISDYLDDNRINYLKYNNLYYYYENLMESVKQPSNFIIQFITSKISRAFYTRKSSFINVNPTKISNLITQVIEKLLSLLPLIKSLNYSYTLEGNKLNINLNTEIVGITNKKFKVNYILNI